MRERLTGSVRNKLFGVIAVLALALVVVAAVGVWSMRSLGATAEDLAHVDAESMEQMAGVEWRVQNVRGHVANHLYVFDGDLAAQDAEAAAIERLKGEIGEQLAHARRARAAARARRARSASRRSSRARRRTSPRTTRR